MEAPPNLAEVKIRAEVEQEVREEHARLDETAALEQRDRRLLALLVSLSFVLLLGLPVVGVAAGLGVRAFVWAAGL